MPPDPGSVAAIALKAITGHLRFAAVDAHGSLVLVSDALGALLQRDQASLIGRPFTAVLDVGGPDGGLDDLQKVLDGTSLSDVPGTLRTASGHIVPVRYDVHPLTDDRGTIVGAFLWTTRVERTLRSSGGVALDRDAQDPLPALIGGAPAMTSLKNDLLRVAADPDVTALVEGESGTGKELVARAIHQHSSRAAAPFVVVNLAGLSRELIESELFGHIKGAFTGAIAERIGPFERANHGTVFLDEIGELPRELQAKLLRVVQERKVQRVGGHAEIPFDVRLIAATNRPLQREVAEGRFREDLYYRLRVFELHVPPLRRRGTRDLDLLIAHFLDRMCARRHRAVPRLDKEVFERLTRHPWPGNVRELEHVIERALVASEGDLIEVGHLPRELTSANGAAAHERSFRLTPERIARALKRHRYNKTHAAASLGVSRYRLRREVQKHHIQDRPAAQDDR